MDGLRRLLKDSRVGEGGWRFLSGGGVFPSGLTRPAPLGFRRKRFHRERQDGKTDRKRRGGGGARWWARDEVR